MRAGTAAGHRRRHPVDLGWQGRVTDTGRETSQARGEVRKSVHARSALTCRLVGQVRGDVGGEPDRAGRLVEHVQDAGSDRRPERCEVAEAEPEGVTRPFLDEGAPMARLLEALRTATGNQHLQTGGASPAYLETLLAAFIGKEPPPETRALTTAAVPGLYPGVLVEPLSARELDVLRLLADGRSNAEIARDLFVEQSTVKTHLIHLYRKLRVSSRTQAINRARTLQLLD